MPTITIPDETYRRLVERAIELGTTAEALAIPALESIVVLPRSTDDWQTQFEAFNALIESRATRYPAGYEADATRDAIYEGCGE
jgi:hypothetical protein